MRRARTVGAGLAVALALGAACSGDDGEAATTTTREASTTTQDAATRDLPPPGALELEPIYGAALAEIGMQLTDRGGLIDRRDGGYEPSAAGTHLALYVEPIGDRTVPEYIEGIRSVAAVFGDVFDRWPGLASYDVCQEPADDDSEPGIEPLPVTQIELTKAEAAAIDWDTVTVVDLVRSSEAEPPGLALRVSSGLRGSSEFEAILEEAL